MAVVVVSAIFVVGIAAAVVAGGDVTKLVVPFLVVLPRSGELRTQKLKSHLVRTQSLNVLPLKPGVGQYIAIHATLTARDFFLAYFYTSGVFEPPNSNKL